MRAGAMSLQENTQQAELAIRDSRRTPCADKEEEISGMIHEETVGKKKKKNLRVSRSEGVRCRQS